VDLTCRRRDAIDLLVIWLDRVEIAADRYHAIPSAVGFKVVRIGILDRVGHHKRAKVGDLGPGAVIVKAYHFIGDGRYPMRAASSGKHGIKGVSDEGNIGYATN
jgi:hypothetical protein